MNPDVVNAIFEGGGAVLLLMNVRRLYLDKKLAGVALAPTVWFNVWGAWNLYYYAKLHQPWSWAAGVGVFLVNTTWVGMAIYYARKKPQEKPRKFEGIYGVSLVHHVDEPKPITLILNDGRVYRADPPGVTWYLFPALERADIEFEVFLDGEMFKLSKYKRIEIRSQGALDETTTTD